VGLKEGRKDRRVGEVPAGNIENDFDLFGRSIPRKNRDCEIVQIKEAEKESREGVVESTKATSAKEETYK